MDRRIRITLDRDLPLRASALSGDAISLLYGGETLPDGWCIGRMCRTDADCCPAPPNALVPIVCRIEPSLSSPLQSLGRCRFY